MFCALTNIRVVPAAARALLIVLLCVCVFCITHVYARKRLYHVTSMLPFVAFCLESVGKPLSFAHESDVISHKVHGRSPRIISTILHGFVFCSALLASLRKRLILLPRGGKGAGAAPRSGKCASLLRCLAYS